MSNENRSLPPKETPDYDFSEGLDVTIRNARNDGETGYHLTPEELRSLPNHGQSPERDALVAEQLANTTTAIGLGGKAVGFSVVSLKGDKNSARVIIHPYAWGGEKAHPLSVLGAETTVAADSDATHIFLDSPGIGKSDNVSLSIQKETALNGRYGALGEHIVKALEHSSIIDGRETILEGDSLAGRVVIGMAPHFKDDVTALMVNDPTGIKEQNLLAGLTGLGLNFLIREGRHVGHYRDTPFDSAAAELHRQGFKLPISEILRRLPQQFVIDSLGLAHGSFADDLADALPRIRKEVRIISPELSELNKWQDIADVFSKVIDTAQSDTLLEQWIVHRHTHSILSGLHPSILAKLYEQRAIGSN